MRTNRPSSPLLDRPPAELLELHERVQRQSIEVRDALAPLVEEAMEEALFRNRVLTVARGALVQFKMDLEITRFDLDATRRERESLLSRLEDRSGSP
ncbi:MAG: hypothetical protein NVSMB9_28490 [Isosphaeraceae bacterium]